jgi:hypothetical protein
VQSQSWMFSVAGFPWLSSNQLSIVNELFSLFT